MKLILALLLLTQVTPVKRVLDIYTKDKLDKTYLEQLHLLAADPAGLKERDVVVKEHIGKTSFIIVLTGKDGGRKYSSKKIITLTQLYAIIDAMPMRREEMLKH